MTPGPVDWTFGREEPGPPSACGLRQLPALCAARFLLPRSGILRRDAGPDPAAVGTPVQHGPFRTRAACLGMEEPDPELVHTSLNPETLKESRKREASTPLGPDKVTPTLLPWQIQPQPREATESLAGDTRVVGSEWAGSQGSPLGPLRPPPTPGTKRWELQPDSHAAPGVGGSHR